MNHQQEIEKSLNTIKMIINKKDEDVEKLKSIFGVTDNVEDIFSNIK